MIADYRIEIKIRNNRLIHYLGQMGYPSIAALCRDHNLSQIGVGELINLKKRAVNKFGEWTALAIGLAKALCCEPDDLWTGAQRNAALKKNWKAVEVAERDLVSFTEVPSPLKLLETEESRKQINKTLATLTPREEDILRMRFGFKPYYHDQTLKKVGEKYNISSTRIMQIERKALRKMRHPGRSRALKDINPILSEGELL